MYHDNASSDDSSTTGCNVRLIDIGEPPSATAATLISTPQASRHRQSTSHQARNHMYANSKQAQGEDLSSLLNSADVDLADDDVDDQRTLVGEEAFNHDRARYSNTRRKFKVLLNEGRTFRGSYRYSRAKLGMSLLKKLFHFLVDKSTLSLFGAFLIHVTIGTVYTLSNVNSYMTSYMRTHGFPNATYAWAVWISASTAIGQGIAMILGGYLEKKFSARLSCSIGCAIHSVSTFATAWSVKYGPLGVLVTYGFLPGFGGGLAYITPMSNGFNWFPNNRGAVSGIIMTGFGIGTFVFNVAQTRFVNPNNLSPIPEFQGYFTQEAVLEKVPSLFVFLGSIYGIMQFIGCCLLFKPPLGNHVDQPIMDRNYLVEPEITLKQAVKRREFIVLAIVYASTTLAVSFINSTLKEYGLIFIQDDLYLAWVGSVASIANASGRLCWGIAVDWFSFTQCFTAITTIFGITLFLMPFKFMLASKFLYLIGTLLLFGSFSGWMSTYPVHVSRVFGRADSGMIYGLIYSVQSACGILTASITQFLIDNSSRYAPFFFMAALQAFGLIVYHVFYPK